MAGNVTGLHQFQNDTGPEPLALLDTNYNALTVALNTLATYSNFYPDTGTLNNLNVAVANTQYASLVDGLQVQVRVANTTTAAATLNVANLGAKPIINNDGSLASLTAGTIVDFVYDAARNSWVVAGGAGAFVPPWTIEGPGTITGNPAFGLPTLVVQGSVASASPNAHTAMVVTPAVAGATAGSNFTGLLVEIGAQTAVGQWPMAVGGGHSGAAAGCSNGLWISAGTTRNDTPVQVMNDAQSGTFFAVFGDGSGQIGSATGGLYWDLHGAFTIYGTGSLPGGGSGGGGGGASYLSQLQDVAVAGMSAGQVLTWNATTGHWVNQAPPALGMVFSVGSPTAGQILAWNGSAWANANPPSGSGGSSTLAGLTDVALAGLTTGQVLQWNGSAWTNATPTGGGGGTQPSWVAPVTVALPTGTYTGTTLIVNGATVPNKAAVIIDRPARTTGGQWDMQIGAGAAMGGPASGSSPGCSNGLVIAAGTNANDSPILVQNDAGTATYFQIHGDGSGFLGSSSLNNFSWDTKGNFVWQRQPATTLNQWMFSIGGGGSSGAAPGYSNGLFVAGGTNSTDYCCFMANDPNNNTFFIIRGDGSGFLGSSGSGLQWDNGGHFTVAGTGSLPGGGTGGGGTFTGSIQAMSDVQLTLPLQTWDALRWNVSLNKWVNLASPPILNNFTDPSVFSNNPGTWFMQIGAAYPPGSGIATGCSNGLFVGAGTNVNDDCVWFMNDNGSLSFFQIRGDGTGHIGPGFIKGMDWDINGVFTLYATSGIRAASGANISFAAIATTATAANVVCDSVTGNLMQSTSSRRYKTNVQTLGQKRARSIIERLRAVTYRSLSKADDPVATHYGLIAEEVAEIDPALVTYDREGRPEAVQYERVLLLLLPVLQTMLEA